ncbi:DNA-directed RNA polymerase III RPC8 [Babesia ovata]|uniref:DNA-directed RNA polymerase III RPC8 n=1 Tax=Babesia ovata TaxID=189622 RepID=A0A2H6KAS6_9APIC|nr:DNA-directed RNA polymerase III RPC8 [Babesia ovata]GBE60085.1 DNA-directed RNA polymerase III RPC8 [Babesia ovata]
MDALMRHLKERYNLRTIVVKAQSHNLVLSDLERSGFSLDLIISAGGDGTFLEAAALLPPSQTSIQRPWIVGLNTDPERSVGAMCMSYFKRGGMVFRRYSGEQRTEPDDTPKQNMIRFTESDALVRKECASDTTGEKEWNNLTQASFCEAQNDGSETQDHCTVISKHVANIYNITYDDYVGSLLERLIVKRDYVPVARQKIRIKMFKRQSSAEQETATNTGDSTTIEDNLFCGTESNFTEDDLDAEACASGDGVIPYGAVNDIIIADKNFGKTFYGLVQVDALPIIRVKSSGVLVSTGTGSTAWAYNMCKMSMGNGFRMLNHLINHKSFPKEAAKIIDAKMMREAIEEHNASLVFDASQNTLKCIIRESISETSTVDATSFMGRQVKLLSLSKNARLVIDGSRIVKVDYGDVVVLKTFESDTIWSCV